MRGEWGEKNVENSFSFQDCDKKQEKKHVLTLIKSDYKSLTNVWYIKDPRES